MTVSDTDDDLAALGSSIDVVVVHGKGEYRLIMLKTVDVHRAFRLTFLALNSVRERGFAIFRCCGVDLLQVVVIHEEQEGTERRKVRDVFGILIMLWRDTITAHSSKLF